MTDFKAIKGFNVKSLATDPKATGAAGATWSSGGDLPAAQSDLAGAGTQTAALAWGGENTPRQVTAEYNGTAWTAGGSFPTAIVIQAGFGTQTAAISAGGFVSGSPNGVTTTEEWTIPETLTKTFDVS